jgi:hypothetical protein
MGERRDDEPSRFDGYEQTREFRLILGIAEAFREEFGVGIDAHPGGTGNEAGEVNRAFRAASRRILQTIVTPADDLPLALTRTIRLAARCNLNDLGVSGDQADSLLESEPGLGDHWFAYLALAPNGVVNDLTTGE